jgi:hypothetical protein
MLSPKHFRILFQCGVKLIMVYHSVDHNLSARIGGSGVDMGPDTVIEMGQARPIRRPQTTVLQDTGERNDGAWA